MMNELLMLWMLAFAVTPGNTQAQVHRGFGGPAVSISISLSSYPALVRVPGYPAYYASRLDSNYFFYDGMYWVYQGDNWYASSWYNGPWYLVAPENVPLYVLRIPVRYYRQPPPYFVGWQSNAPPRWGEHWGSDWSQRHSDWDRWNRNAAPAPAPLPVYQRQYAGERYPHVEQQQALHSQNYRYQPRDPAVRQQHEAQRGQNAAPPRRGAQDMPPERSQGRTSPTPAPAPVAAPRVAPRVAPPPEGRKNFDRSAPPQALPRKEGGEDKTEAQPPKQRGAQRPPPETKPEGKPKAADDVQNGKPAKPVKPVTTPPRKERPPAQQKAEPPRPEAQQPQAEAKAQNRDAATQVKEASPQQEQQQGQGQGKNRERADDRGQDNKR
jgi:hypothetical protein